MEQNWKGTVNEYHGINGLPQPKYISARKARSSPSVWISKLVSPIGITHGGPCGSKKNAEQDAARKFMENYGSTESQKDESSGDGSVEAKPNMIPTGKFDSFVPLISKRKTQPETYEDVSLREYKDDDFKFTPSIIPSTVPSVSSQISYGKDNTADLISKYPMLPNHATRKYYLLAEYNPNLYKIMSNSPEYFHLFNGIKIYFNKSVPVKMPGVLSVNLAYITKPENTDYEFLLDIAEIRSKETISVPITFFIFPVTNVEKIEKIPTLLKTRYNNYFQADVYHTCESFLLTISNLLSN